MSPFKKPAKAGKSTKKTVDEKKVPTGVILLVNGRDKVFVKKVFISGFGWDNGSKKKKLEPETFHQVISRYQLGKIKLLGADHHSMDKNLVTEFKGFVKKNGLREGTEYEVSEVAKIVKKKEELQLT
ncbi:MAG: hypothetical protein WC564_03870 [Patescibacteria group bacterium]|jgi:hypothetical protein